MGEKRERRDYRKKEKKEKGGNTKKGRGGRGRERRNGLDREESSKERDGATRGLQRENPLDTRTNKGTHMHVHTQTTNARTPLTKTLYCTVHLLLKVRK